MKHGAASVIRGTMKATTTPRPEPTHVETITAMGPAVFHPPIRSSLVISVNGSEATNEDASVCLPCDDYE